MNYSVPRCKRSDPPPYTHYGYGIWINQPEEQPVALFVTGYDPGVAMRSAWYPESDLS